MKKNHFIVVALIAIVMLPSCRPAIWKKGARIVEEVIVALRKSSPEVVKVVKTGEEAAKEAKKLAGTEIKFSEKSSFVLRYGDDVMRHVDFQRHTCPSCNGSGKDYYGNRCSHCDGDKYVYKLAYK